MAVDYTFQPSGKTVAFTANTTAPTGVQASPTVTARPWKTSQYRIHNATSVTVFLAFGATAALATANAVIPTGTGANSKDAYPLIAGGIEVFSAPQDTFWSGITASSSGAVYVTPGEGL